MEEGDTQSREPATETVAIVVSCPEGHRDDVFALLENAGVRILYTRTGDAGTFFKISAFQKAARPGFRREARQ